MIALSSHLRWDNRGETEIHMRFQHGTKQRFTPSCFLFLCIPSDNKAVFCTNFTTDGWYHTSAWWFTEHIYIMPLSHVALQTDAWTSLIAFTPRACRRVISTAVALGRDFQRWKTRSVTWKALHKISSEHPCMPFSLASRGSSWCYW